VNLPSREHQKLHDEVTHPVVAGQTAAVNEPYGPDRYGRSFAEVYDRWYPADTSTEAAVELVASLAHGGRVLELGVGTGRLALPLAAAGCEVVGMDSSAEMLSELASKDAGATVTAVLGDVSEPSAWPAGPFVAVVAAFNLLLNLPDAAAQERCVNAAAAALEDGGYFISETAVSALPESRERRLDVRHVNADSVVLIATDADPDAGTIVGQHIELVDGQPVRLRPWRVCACSPSDIDRWALAAGLTLTQRLTQWGPQGTTELSDATAPIAIYRKGN